jgi:Cellulose binding domain
MSRARWLPVVALVAAFGAAAALAVPASFTDAVRNHQVLTAATTTTTTAPTTSTTMPTTTTTPPAPQLKVQTTATSVVFLLQMNVKLQLVNTGAGSASLAAVKVRYWFVNDTLVGVNDFPAVSCVSGCSGVTLTVQPVSPARLRADHYLEVGFTAVAGSLAPGGTRGPISVRLDHSVTTWDLNNDHSRATSAGYVDNTTVTAHLSGTRVWGTEP